MPFAPPQEHGPQRHALRSRPCLPLTPTAWGLNQDFRGGGGGVFCPVHGRIHPFMGHNPSIFATSNIPRIILALGLNHTNFSLIFTKKKCCGILFVDPPCIQPFGYVGPCSHHISVGVSRTQNALYMANYELNYMSPNFSSENPRFWKIIEFKVK